MKIFIKIIAFQIALTICQISIASNLCRFDFQKERRQADKDDHIAQYHLGLMYAKGECINSNKNEAAKWYARSAAKGNHFARHQLALMLKEGDGIASDIVRAIRLLKENEGFPPSMTILGLIYLEGTGVKKDISTGLKLLVEAADFDDAKAEEALGDIYSVGIGSISSDPTQASKWYSKAFTQYSTFAHAGNIDAQLSLCEMYRSGKGVLKNVKAAFRWCKEAADKGSPQAQIVSGGLLYFYGEQLGKSPSDAVNWWNKAADQGETEAFYLLGIAHQSGKVVTKNLDVARSWYMRAAEKGHLQAKERLKNLR